MPTSYWDPSCCSDPNLFTWDFGDPTPLSVYFDTITGVAQGDEVTRPYPTGVDPCLNPRLSGALGFVNPGD